MLLIRLEYFTTKDIAQLIEWSGDEAFLLQWAGPQFQYPLTEEQLLTYMQGANDIQQSDKLIYRVVDSETGDTIGHITLGAIDRYNRSARIGKVLIGGSSARGKGIGVQMITEALRIGFDELGLHRISLGVFDFNQSAIKCYERAGFTKEGLIRDARRHHNEYWSLWEMGILEQEWREQKRP